MQILRNSVPGRRKGRCKGPEAEVFLMCFKQSKVAYYGWNRIRERETIK